MAQRSISLRLEELRGRTVIGVAGGSEKAVAIRSVLRSGLLTGLVTDEATARLVVDQKPARRAQSNRGSKLHARAL